MQVDIFLMHNLYLFTHPIMVMSVLLLSRMSSTLLSVMLDAQLILAYRNLHLKIVFFRFERRVKHYEKTILTTLHVV